MTAAAAAPALRALDRTTAARPPSRPSAQSAAPAFSAPHGLVRSDDRAEGEVLVSPSGRVRATPPPPGARYYRVSVMDEAGRRIGQTSGGTTRAAAERKLRELDRRLAAHAPIGATATRGFELLDYFADPTRPKNLSQRGRPQHWSPSYADQTAGIVERYLRPAFGPVPLSGWSPTQAYRALDRCPTNYMVDKVRRTLSAILALGVADGFLRPDQRELHRVTVPLREERRPARRPRARQADATALLMPDEVPSLDQVRRLATARQPGTSAEQWDAAVNLLAYAGVRVGELFALSADDVLGDYPDGLVAVRWQVIEPRGCPKRLAPPKNGYGRLIAVCDCTPLGFPLRDWLIDRAHLADRDRARGRNPQAALIVGPGGGWWNGTAARTGDRLGHAA